MLRGRLQSFRRRTSRRRRRIRLSVSGPARIRIYVSTLRHSLVRYILTTTNRRMEIHRPQRRSRRLARQLESERERARRQHQRQQGQSMEGAVERRVGVCEDDRGVDV
jgi:hypothetical protein